MNMNTSTIENALLCGKATMAYGIWMSQEPENTSYDSIERVPTVLESHSDLTRIYNANTVILKRVEFNVYDQTIVTGEDLGINTVFNSLSSENDQYVQTRFRGAQMFDFQPNFFAPNFKVNGTDQFGSLRVGASGVGFPMPYQILPFVSLANVQNIQVSARCAQKVEVSAGTFKYVPYNVYCHAEFILFN